ncbi:MULTISPECIES: efflux RND transporter periplasmic adaptor subunit [unclassified Flavobacterium]|uniref:efflux RND transporter periplasmic adaptor subunit n=1 Tax=unclassified Flavobacterium TaxID=196869 RepID=UPI00261CAB9D|nr:efflux RND transporter periplasmic adaptor subunit [Flavobacterium sp.]
MKKKIITAVVILGSLGLIAYVLSSNKAKNEEKTAVVAETNATVVVKIDTIKTQPVAMDFVANGNFYPSQELNFSAENSGRVTKVLVDEGTPVRIGQTLAIIKADKINVDLQNAEASYQNAATDAQRFESAYKTGGVTKQQLDQAKLALANAKAHLQQARITLGDASIKSSINGIVNKRFIEPGSVVSPGTQLFELVNVSTLKLKVTVSEDQIAGLKIGSPIKVKASVYPDKEFNGKITFIAPKADSSLNFPVEIEIANNAGNDLKAGMYGTALFSPSSDKTPLMIAPRNAFVGSVSANQVFVMQKDGTAKMKNVTAGRIIGEKVEILNGLSNGDIVITSGQINLTDGAKVTVLK